MDQTRVNFLKRSKPILNKYLFFKIKFNLINYPTNFKCFKLFIKKDVCLYSINNKFFKKNFKIKKKTIFYFLNLFFLKINLYF